MNSAKQLDQTKTFRQNQSDLEISKLSTKEVTYQDVSKSIIITYEQEAEFIRNAIEHFSKVESFIDTSKEQLKEYRKQIDEYRQCITQMHYKVQRDIDGVPESMVATFERQRKQLDIEIKKEEADTAQLRQQILQLNKEKFSIEEQIILVKARIEKLEQQIGTYTFTTNQE